MELIMYFVTELSENKTSASRNRKVVQDERKNYALGSKNLMCHLTAFSLAELGCNPA
jgi:hypothetical protein